jgi:hypothetical protein
MSHFRTIRRRLPRLASAICLAVLAVAVAVPYPALGCCATKSLDDCCCRKHQAEESATVERTCCQRDSAATTSETFSSESHAPIGTCACCQEAPPQNVPADRNADRAPVEHGFAVPIAHWSVTPTFFVAGSFDTPIEHLTAIPHRILHCSWLI